AQGCHVATDAAGVDLEALGQLGGGHQPPVLEDLEQRQHPGGGAGHEEILEAGRKTSTIWPTVEGSGRRRSGPDHGGHPMSTIAVVAGSNLGAWAWERVTPRLTAAGHDVHPLTLTGLGDRAHLASPDVTVTTHSDDIVAALETADLRDVVLVAHSYAGAPAT